MMAARSRENPHWVSAQDIAVAQPMMNMMAPDSEAVSTSSFFIRAPVPAAVDHSPATMAVDDADGGNLGRRGDAGDHREADEERQHQRRHRGEETLPDLLAGGPPDLDRSRRGGSASDDQQDER